MRLLERYVLGELLRVFGVLVFIATSLLVFVGVFGQAKEHNLGYLEIIQILPFVVPSLLPYTIPATLLLTVCVVYGRLSGDNEIIAAKAAGINVINLMWPSFFLAAMLSVASLLLSDQIVPWAFANIQRIVALAMENIFIDQLRTQSTINAKKHGITITVTGVRGRTLIQPVIRYAPSGKQPITLVASEARLTFDLPRERVLLRLQEAQTLLPGKSRGSSAGYLQDDTIPFPLPRNNEKLRGRDLRIEDIRREIMRNQELHEQACRTQALDASFALTTGQFERLNETKFLMHNYEIVDSLNQVRRLNTELHNRFAMAVSCLFFVLLGSPFAILMARNQFLTSFLFCFLPILIVYYPVSMMTQNLSKTGSVDPAWAVWCANALLGLAAAYFMRRVLQR